MKVLWLTNIYPRVVAKDIGAESSYAGGWIDSLYSTLSKMNIEFIFCFPYKKNIYEKRQGYSYYGFFTGRRDYLRYSDSTTKYFVDILSIETPDIVHIFGTEYPYVLSMINASERIKINNKVVINIQGLVSVYKLHFFAGIPYKYVHSFTLKELVRNNNNWRQYKSFEYRGKLEVISLEKVKYIIGRTEWDKACVTEVNPATKYFCINENMRDSFYENKWEYTQCARHTIFASQGNYPIKGLHKLLEAFSIILKQYPAARLKIAGQNIIEEYKSIRHRTSYAKYLTELISSKGLSSNVDFLGPLNEKEMCEQFLKANVFVSPSSIENSSNSVSEALLLGVPLVSSNVGGINTLVTDKIEGFLYPFDEPYMLAYYVDKIFRQGANIEKISTNARKKAVEMFDREKNADKTYSVYYEILGDE